MTNLWGFLLQTLYVSLVGGLLLLVKWLLRDKLTPRWQYGVWSVLALRILIPVQTVGKYVLLPLPLWVETGKTLVERTLDSAYSSVYLPADIMGPIPLVSQSPKSITDWLFLLYVGGMVLMLARYLVSYLRLGALIRKGEAPPLALRDQIERVGQTYGLPSCRAVVISGLPSPMVFGVFRPVLAVPAGAALDDHVILHELFHIKYRDALQNVFWAVCRALHWCNPFVHYLMNRIGNDMESLCDQRVLERLEGEERRDYGLSLLAMANDRYPRAPGTTSISNGGRNIARRIEAIVRFKKYPAGMALASVCVTVMLLCGCMTATMSPQFSRWPSLLPKEWAVVEDLVTARMIHCTTPAGALETYGKGLQFSDRSYLIAASPQSTKEELIQEAFQIWDEHPEDLRYQNKNTGGVDLLVYETVLSKERIGNEAIPTGALADVRANWISPDYSFYNLMVKEDGSYTCQCVFVLSHVNTDDMTMLRYCNEPTTNYVGLVVIPLHVYQETGWVVEETGEKRLYLCPEYEQDTVIDTVLPSLCTYYGEGACGTVTVRIQTEYRVDTDPELRYHMDNIPDPYAEFYSLDERKSKLYTFSPNGLDRQAENTAEIKVLEWTEEGADLSDESLWNAIGGSSVTIGQEEGTLSWGSGGGTISHAGDIPEPIRPQGFAAQFLWNEEVQETLLLKEVPQ